MHAMPRDPLMRDAAVKLQACLERYGWRFSLTQDHDLYVTVGDDPPSMPQPAVWWLISTYRPELLALLTDQRVH